jgi:hypothetical protein
MATVCHVVAAQQPTRDQAAQALRRAVGFFHSQVSTGGGYVWRYSADLKLSEGEGKTTATTMVWVQPPGTPTVGMAFLDAYQATEGGSCLQAATDAANVLLSGQLRTGGWYYHIELDATKRLEYAYRDVPAKKFGRRQSTTTLDDNTTQAAICFLMRLDKLLGFEDQRLHEAVGFTLEALLIAQHPNGAWYQNWREFPEAPSVEKYPVIPASYPPEWSRKWLNDWLGRYYLNDNVLMDVIDVMLDAYDTYGDERYLESARHAGDFLVLAQMPDPQPAWAQQYDPAMHPCWDRKFEPPAITAWESQGALSALMLLYRRTGDRKYLAPVPRALQYLRASQLPDGNVARFYELQTNRPLYFTKDYDSPRHYSFVVESRLDDIEAEYQRLLGAARDDLWPAPRDAPPTAAEIRQIIDSMDERGAWVEEGVLDAHDMKPESGIIASATFAENVGKLSRFIAAAR